MKYIVEKLNYVLNDINLKTATDPDAEGQSVSAHVVGYRLDNAFGDNVLMDAILRGYQEFVLVLETYKGDREPVKRPAFDTTPYKGSDAFREVHVNMASLIALIRQTADSTMRISAESVRMQTAVETIQAIQMVTKDASDDMHEPDSQDIGMKVTNADTHSVTDELQFVLYKNSMKVEFNMTVLLDMIRVALIGRAPAALARRKTMEAA